MAVIDMFDMSSYYCDNDGRDSQR